MGVVSIIRRERWICKKAIEISKNVFNCSRRN